jgi:hypothetical protein
LVELTFLLPRTRAAAGYSHRPSWAGQSGGGAFGAATVPVDQRMGELPLAARKLEPVRLELFAARVAAAQGLSLRNERSERFLQALDFGSRS